MPKDIKKYYIEGYLISLLILFIYSYLFFEDIIISLILSAMFAPLGVKDYVNFKLISLRMGLALELREYLEILNNSILAGNNIYDAIDFASSEINHIFTKDSIISRQSELLRLEIENGTSLDQAFIGFKKNLSIEDADIFVDTINVGISTGMDINLIIQNSKKLINEKISMDLEIDRIMKSSKRELLIMMILPIIVLLVLKFTSQKPIFNLVTYMIRFIVFLIFIFSYKLAKKIIELEI